MWRLWTVSSRPLHCSPVGEAAEHEHSLRYVRTRFRNASGEHVQARGDDRRHQVRHVEVSGQAPARTERL